MSKTDEKKGKKDSFLRNVLMGVFAGFAVSILLFGIAAAFVSGERLPESMMNQTVLVILFTGTFFGGYTAAKKHRARVLLTGICAGAVMFFITLIGSAFSADTPMFEGIKAVSLAAMLLGGALGGIAGINKKKYRRR